MLKLIFLTLSNARLTYLGPEATKTALAPPKFEKIIRARTLGFAMHTVLY